MAEFPFIVISLGSNVINAAELKARTVEQNAMMWSMLTDISSQVTWYGLKYIKEDWKDIISASVSKQRMAPSIDNNGVVMLGIRTSKQDTKWMADMITQCHAFGIFHGVKFKVMPEPNYDDYPEVK